MAVTWIKRIPVKSTSSEDVYTVAQKVDGTFGCSCKAWIFQRKKMPNGHCKHITFALAHDAFGLSNEKAKSRPRTREDALAGGFEFFLLDLEERPSGNMYVSAAGGPDLSSRE